jgi:hypothetical protein
MKILLRSSNPSNGARGVVLKIREQGCSGTVIPKLGGMHQSGARNIEIGARKNYGNAPKLNYQLMKLSMYLLTLQNP